MPKYIVLNTIKSDGVGDFSHFEDIMHALNANPHFSDVEFLLIVLFQERGTPSSCERLYENFLKRMNVLGHPYLYGTQASHQTFVNSEQVQQSLSSADQVIIISYDKVFPIYEPYLKQNITIKYIGEHDCEANQHDRYVWPEKMFSHPREWIIRGLGLSEENKSYGIKVKDVPICSMDKALQVIKAHDALFLEQVAACSQVESMGELLNNTIIIPVYFSSDFNFIDFISILAKNPSIPKDKQIVIYHSGTNFNQLNSTMHASLIRYTLTRLPVTDIQIFEPGNRTPTIQFMGNACVSRSIKIFSGFYISEPSFQALYQLAYFAAVSGDNTLERCVSTKTLPFYWSTNSGCKERTLEALESLSQQTYLSMSDEARDSFSLFFSLCKEPCEHPEEYEKLDFPAMKEAWPLIATYIKEHRNFYNQLDAIVCSELSETALPEKLRRNYDTQLTQNTARSFIIGAGSLLTRHSLYSGSNRGEQRTTITQKTSIQTECDANSSHCVIM